MLQRAALALGLWRHPLPPGPDGRDELARGFVEPYVTVTDGDYDDIREMLEAAEAAAFLTLR